MTLWYPRKGLVWTISFPSVFLWFAHHPFGAATMVYAASVLGVLVYAYFEPRDHV
jgi:hypothetical protein